MGAYTGCRLRFIGELSLRLMRKDKPRELTNQMLQLFSQSLLVPVGLMSAKTLLVLLRVQRTAVSLPWTSF